MKDNEQIIRSLQACADGVCERCDYGDVDGIELCGSRQLMADAAALLRELTEPRVISLDEIVAWLTPVFMEIRAEEDGEDEWTGWVEYDYESKPAFVFTAMGKERRLWADKDEYNRTWRCWSLMPTWRAREAAAWRA